MAQDFADLATTEGYAALLTRISDRDVALALGLDPATTSPTNVKTNSIRWNSASGYWEKYNGSAWAALASTYQITANKANHLAAGVAGALVYQSGSGATGYSAAGTAGQVALSGGTGAPTWSNLGLITYGYTSKATPVDADSLPLSDSAAANGAKKLTVANLKAAIFSGWGALIAAGTSKTPPVDADAIALADSAASNATKKLTWANLKAALKTYFDTLYMALVSPGTSGNVLTSNGSAWTSAAPPASASQAEMEAGTETALRQMSPLRVAQAIAALSAGLALGTKQNASGSSINFTTIPAGTKRITVNYSALSSNGSALWYLQIGDSGGLETSGYLSAIETASTRYTATTGFGLIGVGAASWSMNGRVVLELLDSATNTWIAEIMSSDSAGGAVYAGAGSKALSATLDRLSLVTTDTWDAGMVNITYQ